MHRAFSMEPVPTNNDVAIINTIDAEINKQCINSVVEEVSYYVARGFGNFALTAGYDPSSVLRQTEENARKIMGIVHAFKSVQWNENMLKTLYDKNTHFKRAMDYYIERLLNYYEKITIENLNKAVNPELQHPLTILNTLASGIKKYIMNNALKKITHEYTMEFQEDDCIENFDICEYDTIHLAATSSNYCDHISIWNLLTGKLLRRIGKEGNLVACLSLSPTGSQLATSMQNTDGTFCCKIWNPQCGSLLYNIPQAETGPSLCYLYESCNNTLMILKNSSDIYWNKQEVWLLDKSNPEYRGSSFIRASAERSLPKITTSYKAAHPLGQLGTSKKLYVTNTMCPWLYLCKRAINNAETVELVQKIEGTRPFLALTDYEKPMIRVAVRNKIEALSEKKLRIQVLNKILDEDL